jgi:MFS family permease
MFRLIIACSYSWFMWNMMYTTVVPMLPFYAQEYNLTPLHVAIILASLQIGFLMGVCVMNIFTLRPVPAINLGGICYVIGPAIIAWDPGLYTLVLGRFIEGFGAAPLVITHDSTLARRLLPHQKGRAFGIKGAIGTTGLFFGPIVGGILFQYGGLRLPMIIICIMGCLGLVIYFGLLPPETFVERNEVLANGSTVAERFSHFGGNQLLPTLMAIQMMTFMLIGIMFLAVPDFLYSFWDIGMLSLTLMWVLWDMMKVAGSLLGGTIADRGSPWVVTFGGLMIQSFMMMITAEAANSAMDKQVGWKFYWFVIAAGSVFAVGTTVDGFIGGPFVKLMTEVERMLGKVCYEEMFCISCSVVACGEAVGNLYCGIIYSWLGFGMTLYSFAWFQLVGMLIAGYSVQGLIRPLFEKEKKELDSDDF